jgi:hypothetical protein
MENHDDFAFEPIRGLPDHLPKGERLLWQGAPDWRLLAIQAFHVRKVAIYFALIAAWQWTTAMADGAGFLEAGAGLWMLGLSAAVALGLLTGLAWLYARTTVYSLTSKRLVMRAGIALPVTLNLPLSLVENATVARRADGSGGIAFEVTRPDRVAWLVAWPNARPWHFNHPQPMLRALREVEPVARLVADALSTGTGSVRAASQRPASKPANAASGLVPQTGQPA